MGEIADALRRAQGVAPKRAVGPPPRPLTDASPRLYATAETRVTPNIPALSPSDPAIAVASGADVEACRRVAVRLREALAVRGARSFAVVSAAQGEGKTTVLCDLAVALASISAGGQIAVVDLDLRRPSIRSVLALPTRVGIEDYLAGRASLDEVAVTVGDPPLDIYPTLVPQAAAHTLLVSPRFASMIDELERRHTYVLIDTPPVLLLPDTSLILQRVGSCVVVVREGYSRTRLVKQLVAALPPNRVVGMVLNAARMSKASRYAYEYREESPEQGSDPVLERGRDGE